MVYIKFVNKFHIPKELFAIINDYIAEECTNPNKKRYHSCISLDNFIDYCPSCRRISTIGHCANWCYVFGPRPRPRRHFQIVKSIFKGRITTVNNSPSPNPWRK